MLKKNKVETKSQKSSSHSENKTETLKQRPRKRKQVSDEKNDYPSPKKHRVEDYIATKPEDIEEAESKGLRRTKRVRFKPFPYWANTRLESCSDPLTLDYIREHSDSIIKFSVDTQNEAQWRQRNKKNPKKKEKKLQQTK